MQARSAARRLALDVLYEAEIRDCLPLEAFELRRNYGWVVPASGDQDEETTSAATEPPPDEAVAYARHLVAGVQEHSARIDELIARYADRWAIERMPMIDRNVVRIALFELMEADGDVPVPVAINEAVELVKALSTDGSGRFVNGLLGRIAETLAAD